MKFLLLLPLFALGCVTPSPVVPDDPDPKVVTCATMCDHLRDLGCPAGQPTPKGIRCEQTCANVQDSGVIDLDLACMTRATSCEAADTCGARRRLLGPGLAGNTAPPGKAEADPHSFDAIPPKPSVTHHIIVHRLGFHWVACR